MFVPEAAPRERRHVLDRLADKFLVGDGCWEWTATRVGGGYGQFRNAGVKWYAHIFMWQLFNGPVPEGMTIDHVCHNEAAERGECAGGPDCLHRRCVRPDHLVPKSQRDNSLASPNSMGRRTHCRKNHPYDKENTYFRKNKNGTVSRVCRACRHATYLAYKERKKRARP